MGRSGDAKLSSQIDLDLGATVEHVIESVKPSDRPVERWVDPANRGPNVGMVPAKIGAVPNRFKVEHPVASVTTNEVVAPVYALPRESRDMREHLLQQREAIGLPKALMVGIAHERNPEAQREFRDNVSRGRLDTTARERGLRRGNLMTLARFQRYTAREPHVGPDHGADSRVEAVAEREFDTMQRRQQRLGQGNIPE